MEYAINASNDVKKESKVVLENNLNDLGYEFIFENDTDKAFKIYKLNTILFPNSSNAFGSMGQLLLKINKKDDA